MKTFELLYIDPPWNQTKGGTKKVRPKSSGKPLDYPIMSVEDIKKHLQYFTDHTSENSIVFLWTIDKYLFEAESMIKDLGYKIHARMIWNKVTGIPAAFTIRYGHEYLLYCYRGKFTPIAKEERGKIHSVFTEKVMKHSKKPEIAYQIIERLYPNLTKLELYAREKRSGWSSWGNEIKCSYFKEIEGEK